MKNSILILLCLLPIANLFSQTIPAARTTDWSHTGYPDSIPNPQTIVDVTSFGAVGDGITDNAGAIYNAINSLFGQRGVIYFPAGTFLCGLTLNLPDSVILRGASADSTHLAFNLNGAAVNAINVSGSPNSPFTNVLSGYQRGSFSIVVVDPSAFSVGRYAELQEDNGAWDTQPASWAANSVGQILHITAVHGDTLIFDHALNIDYNPLLNVQVRTIVPAKEVGIECMQISRDDSVHTGLCINIYFYYAVNCWVRGVESSKSVGSHIEADQSSNISITGCYIHHSYEYDGVSTHGYGITLFKHTVQCKVENNIMKHLRHCYSLQCGSNGNVIAYNYSLDPNRSEFPSNFGADISMHGHFTFSNLFESNIVQNLQLDSTWGPTGPFNTFFRNRAELYGIFMSAGVVPTDSQNFVGNEVTGTGLGQGNYLINGSGHFEFGNNLHGTITPTGTSPLNDSSYYLTSAPSYWTGASAWPSIGIPNTISTGTIPAKSRYISGSNFTVCSDQLINSVKPLSLDNNALTVFPNPNSGDINIVLDQSRSSSGELTLEGLSGNIISKMNLGLHPGENIILFHNLINANPGIYFLKIQSGEGVFFKKIILL